MRTYITTADALDIAVTAAEGGVNYWTPVTDYDPDWWDDDDRPRTVRSNRVLFRVHDEDSGVMHSALWPSLLQ